MTTIFKHDMSETLAVRDLRIRDAQARVIERTRVDLDAARSTNVTHARVENGLACEVIQGAFSVRMDLGRGMGGDASGPSPSFFARAAIGGCVAIAVKMLAAREGLLFHAVDVAVETDFDDAALFGLGSGHAAPLATRVMIDILTDEAEVSVRDVVERALEMDPWYLALRDAQTVGHALSVRQA